MEFDFLMSYFFFHEQFKSQTKRSGRSRGARNWRVGSILVPDLGLSISMRESYMWLGVMRSWVHGTIQRNLRIAVNVKDLYGNPGSTKTKGALAEILDKNSVLPYLHRVISSSYVVSFLILCHPSGFSLPTSECKGTAQTGFYQLHSFQY